MNKKSTAAVTPFRNFNDASTKVTGVENAHRHPMHERMPLHELKQVSFNVGSNSAVRFDDPTRFRIYIVPMTADLRLKPTLQRPQQVRESLSARMWPFHSLELWQQLEGTVSASPIFAR